MSMKIQTACSNGCEGVKDFALAAGAWIGKTVTTARAFITEGAKKAATFAKPYFEQLKVFAENNKQPIIIAVAGFALGVVAHVVINNIFCKRSSSDPSGQPIPNPPGQQQSQQTQQQQQRQQQQAAV
jgi:hypothetical protein